MAMVALPKSPSLQVWATCLLGAATLAIALLAFLPIRQALIPAGDKASHVAAFACLAVLAGASGMVLGAVVARLMLLAALVEGLQTLPFITREASLMDFGASVLGVAIGMVVWGVVDRLAGPWVRRWRQRASGDESRRAMG
ncbi:MAG: hypothetical protein AAF253_14895 [Pseudomonadota bacterium]